MIRATVRMAWALAIGALLLPAAASASKVTPNVVGGHPAASGSWPSTVALIRRSSNPDPQFLHFCGGTLIAREWVVTAAHCVDRVSADGVDVLVGTRRLVSDSGTRVPVAEIHAHPDYVPYQNDIALLRLQTPVDQPTMAVPAPSLSPQWDAGAVGGVAGWGLIGDIGTTPRDLMEATVPFVSDADCSRIGGAPVVAAIMVCAGDLARGGVDTCSGDSGGPLTADDARGRPLLVGVTSFGIAFDCGRPNAPGVYAEVSALRAFVDETIGWQTAAAPDAPQLRFERPAAGASTPVQTVRLTSQGTAPLSVAGVALTDADEFEIVEEDCSLTSLPAGESCTVSLRATPTRDADADATLSFDADLATGPATVGLESSVTPAPDPDPDPDPGPVPGPKPDVPSPPATPSGPAGPPANPVAPVTAATPSPPAQQPAAVCRSRRTIRIRMPRDARSLGGTVASRARVVRRIRASRRATRTVLVDLTGLRSGRYTVRVDLRNRAGKHRTIRRSYRTCVRANRTSRS